MKKIALVNRSKRVSDEQLAAMAEALQTQANEHFAPAWGTEEVTVETFTHVKHAPDDAHQILLLDEAGDESADGYHTTTANGEPYSKVLVKVCLEAGGGILVGGDLDENTDESDDTSDDANADADADDYAATDDDADDDSDEEEEVDPDTISATASHELLEMLRNRGG